MTDLVEKIFILRSVFGRDLLMLLANRVARFDVTPWNCAMGDIMAVMHIYEVLFPKR